MAQNTGQDAEDVDDRTRMRAPVILGRTALFAVLSYAQVLDEMQAVKHL